MLASYRQFQSSHADEIEAGWIENSCGRGVEIADAGAGREFFANLARFDDGVLTFCSYDSPIAVSLKLADVSGVSAQSVIWYFKKRHACTPQQYLERLRVQMAQLLLRVFSGQPNASVALQCGFLSVAALERSYEQHFELAPAAPHTVHY
jgi:AraC-like DNA-binding protein